MPVNSVAENVLGTIGNGVSLRLLHIPSSDSALRYNLLDCTVSSPGLEKLERKIDGGIVTMAGVSVVWATRYPPLSTEY